MEDYIEYRGNSYWCKELNFPGRGIMTVSDTKLNEILMEDLNSSDKKVIKQAEVCDNKIYYFLDEEEQQMKDANMIKYINGTL